jgi:hypothetical protein
MYRELQPLRQALSTELKAALPPAGPGIEPEDLLQTYLDRLTMYVGCDVADQTFALCAVDAAGEELGHLLHVPNNPCGFEQVWEWLERLRDHHRLRIILLSMETSGIYYWALWTFLAGHSNLARTLFPLPSSSGGCYSRQQPFRRFHFADKGVGSCIQDCLTCLRSPTEHDHVQVVTDTA